VIELAAGRDLLRAGAIAHPSGFAYLGVSHRGNTVMDGRDARSGLATKTAKTTLARRTAGMRAFSSISHVTHRGAGIVKRGF
jgi:hypothetical protein